MYISVWSQCVQQPNRDQHFRQYLWVTKSFPDQAQVSVNHLRQLCVYRLTPVHNLQALKEDSCSFVQYSEPEKLKYIQSRFITNLSKTFQSSDVHGNNKETSERGCYDCCCQETCQQINETISPFAACSQSKMPKTCVPYLHSQPWIKHDQLKKKNLYNFVNTCCRKAKDGPRTHSSTPSDTF